MTDDALFQRDLSVLNLQPTREQQLENVLKALVLAAEHYQAARHARPLVARQIAKADDILTGNIVGAKWLLYGPGG